MGCPYCHATITAPASSTLPDDAPIPTASPVVQDRVGSSAAGEAGWRGGSNRPAVVAFALAAVAILGLLTAGMIVAPHAEELLPLSEAIAGAKSFEEVLEAQRSFYEAHGGMPRWMLAAGLLYVVCALSAIAALVCGLVGLRRSTRRGLAAGAVVASGVTLLLMCGGFQLGC